MKPKLSETRLRNIIKEAIIDVINEENDKQQMNNIRNQVAREILGTDSFEEFYRNTGFMVGAQDYYLMSQYFKRLAEVQAQMDRK